MDNALTLKTGENEGLGENLNTVFLGDVKDLLRKVPDHSVDLVYSDPDYNVGVKYNEIKYSKSFDEYIEWYIDLARESLRVCKETGNLFFINYPRQNAHLRVKYLEDAAYAVQEYVWIYNTNIGHSKKRFTTAHRSILHVVKGPNNAFYKDQVAVPYRNPDDPRIKRNVANGSPGRMPYSWFYFDLVKNISREKSFHSCQIPQKLAEMLILATTKPNDVVFVHFGGSGSELEICKALGRRFLSAEIDPKYHELILDRLAKGKVAEEYRMLTQIKKRREQKESPEAKNRRTQQKIPY